MKSEPGLVEAANRRVAKALRKRAEHLLRFTDFTSVGEAEEMDRRARRAIASEYDALADELEAGTEGERE